MLQYKKNQNKTKKKPSELEAKFKTTLAYNQNTTANQNLKDILNSLELRFVKYKVILKNVFFLLANSYEYKTQKLELKS